MTDEEILAVAGNFGNGYTYRNEDLISFARALLSQEPERSAESAASAVPVAYIDSIDLDFLQGNSIHECVLHTISDSKDFVPLYAASPTPPTKSDPGWMDIESAPKDKPILVFNAVCGPYISKFTEGEFPLGFWNGFGTWYPKPTHWMPIPAAPAETKSEPSNTPEGVDIYYSVVVKEHGGGSSQNTRIFCLASKGNSEPSNDHIADTGKQTNNTGDKHGT